MLIGAFLPLVNSIQRADKAVTRTMPISMVMR